MQGDIEVDVEVEYYDRLAIDAALHNPLSDNAFSRHVHFGIDRRIGNEVLRPGY